jgi:hypothetical protein
VKRFEPRVERLLDTLARGIGSETADEARKELALRAEADDEDVARSLVQIISACAIATAGDAQPARPSDPGRGKESASGSPDASLLGQLLGEGKVDQLDNADTLLGVLRAGTLSQRRAAIRRIVARIESREFRGEVQKRVATEIYAIRDVELDFELEAARALLMGRRAARADRDDWERMLSMLEDSIVEFWEAASTREPVSELPSVTRARLLLRLRDASDIVAAHVGALIEGNEGTDPLALLTSLRHAADPRLVPSLGVALEDDRQAVAVAAARALRRIDDPRVPSMLLAAYKRSPRDAFRAIVGGSLADHGDPIARDYVRGLLDREDTVTLSAAVEAMESLGVAEDADALSKLLDHPDELLVRSTVRSLGRVSDGRGLRSLVALRAKTTSSSLRAEIEDAHNAILARLELRGEEPAPDDTQAFEIERDVPRIGGKRFAAWRSFIIGQFWVAIGVKRAGMKRLERASKLRPGWSSPHIAMGLSFTRQDQHAQSLGAFRRALEADRRRVERNPIIMRALARSFIARAEEVEQEGRADVARGLVREALSLDLRWASGPQRFELERRRTVLRRGLPG